MLIMGTRAAAFTAKVRSLNDYQLRLLHGILPAPSGVDIANTLKYFSQTLLTVLKDVPNSPLEMLKSKEKDATRLGLFPSLEYKGLYRAVTQLLEVAPLIQYGLQPFGISILQCLGCLLPFLDSEMIDSLPYLVASALAVLPLSLHQEVINSLCFYILPFTITRKVDEEESYASQSVTSVIMLVFQHSNSLSHHCQLIECLMALKPGVVRDVLCVIAHGTSTARASAARLLFYYWPNFNPSLCDMKVNQLKVSADWTPFVCQRDMCPNAGNAEAAKVCYDHCISITFSSDSPPPLYLCIECANAIHREHPNQMFYDILHPMQNMAAICENKNCRAQDKHTVSVCFASECASYNGNHPIRFCQQCHNNRHNNRRGGDHIVHKSLPVLWDMDAEMQVYLIESIVSLLKEARPGTNNPNKDPQESVKSSILNTPPPSDNMTLEESQMLGRYGVWLLVGLCTPREDTSSEILGRLLSMLFHWFYVTAYLYDDQVLSEGTLEKLKNEHVCKWLNEVSRTHFKVFVSCLMPHPPDYARVGGHWDTLTSKTCHLKEGLHRLLCLVPYEVVSGETWEHIMPRWLEAIVTDVPPRELVELKLLLSKILDPVMSPLGFDAKKMYRFLSIRFKKTTSKVQEQALNWLQVLTTLDIVVPLSLLFSVFNDGIKSMQPSVKTREKSNNHLVAEEESRRSSISPVKEEDSGNVSPLSDDDAPVSKTQELETDVELDLSCCILMLDILLKQMELQNVEKHCGISTSLAQDIWQLLKSMLTAQWSNAHHCEQRECAHCEARIMWYQLVLELVTLINPEETAHPPDTFVEETSEEGQSRKSPPESDKKQETKPEVVINMPIPLLEVHTVGGVLVHMPHIMTATVETVAEQLDLAPVVAAERILPAVARQVTISDADVATATAQVAKATLVGENDQLLEAPEEDAENFWQTSEGRFHFVIEELPAHLQLLYTLLSSLPKSSASDLYYALQCIHILVLHGDAFTKASKDDRGFFIWCQENLLIKNLWEFCDANQSHIGEVVVPLLLHCVTLPSGSDTFWKVIQEDFQNSDWRVRFTAVERVTVIARFMDQTPLYNEYVLQAALANVFCYLISSMDDENVQVAQRATLYLGTIHDSAVKSLVGCLETQFDTVIVDRPVVLQALYQLHNCLSDRKILTWDFFLNRFDALFLEAQINLEKSGDISFVRDLRNSNLSCEAFARKLNRAHEALSRSESSNDSSIKTLSASFGPKWPYKRTMSAPASMVPQQDPKQDKEKVYSRQYSAPILKRKSSRFGLGQFLGSVPPNTSLPDGHIHQLVAGDDSGLAGLSRVLNLEGNDHETIHLLIFLLMQFLSRSDQAFPSEERSTAKTQAIVLRHLFLLLGYSQQENTFYFPPQRLRSSPVFNAFLANLPQVLDQNHLMGWIVAGPGMAVLQHCPAGRSSSSSTPSYTLWLLEPHIRRCWLMSVLVLLYKYNYNQQPQASQLTSLIRIVLNTICAQHHVCKRVPSSVIIGSSQSRSREMSQPSLGGDKEDGNNSGDKHESPPMSPMCSANGKTKSYIQKSSTGLITTHWEESDEKVNQSSVEGEEQDGETVVTPESQWKSGVGVKESGEETTERKSSLHEKVKSSWFLGNDDETKEKQEEAERKCGVKQGVKMMVTSSLFASSQPVTSKSPNLYNGAATQSRPPQTRPILPSNCSERRSSLASAVATAMQPVVATATVVSVPTKQTPSGRNALTSVVSHSISPPSSVKQLTSEGRSTEMAEKCKSLDQSKKSGHSSSLDWATSSSSPHSPEPRSTSPRPVTAPWRIESALSCSIEKKFSNENRTVDFETHSYGSPESPLSKMDIITLGSPVEIDNVSTRDNCSSKVTHLEMPPPERLLPVGPCQDVNSLTDRLHRALTNGCCSNSLDHEHPQSSVEVSKKPDGGKTTRPSKQDSLERPESRQVRSSSPRRLIKQVALAESPPEDEPHSLYRGVHSDKKHHMTSSKERSDERDRKKNEKAPGKRKRKVGLFSMGSAPRTHLPRRPGSWCGSQQPLLDPATQQACHAAFNLRQSSFRIGDDCVLQRCAECGAPREEYSDEEMGLCIVILGTFIHREPGLAAPLLPKILSTVANHEFKTETKLLRKKGRVVAKGGGTTQSVQFPGKLIRPTFFPFYFVNNSITVVKMDIETAVSRFEIEEEKEVAAEVTELEEFEDEEKKKIKKGTKKAKKKKDDRFIAQITTATKSAVEAEPTLQIKGLKNVKLTSLTQKIMGCIVGEHVTAEAPWTTISKVVVDENLYLHHESSDFLPVKDDLSEYSDSTILVGYDPNYMPYEGEDFHRFYIAVTESARDEVLAKLEEEKRLAEERLRNSINKRILPWKSLGSEVEVDESIVKNTRPLIQLELETDIDALLKPVKFRDREVDDVKDGYVRIGPGRQEFSGVMRMRVDAGVQSVPSVMANAAQTDPGLPTNTWTQYFYDMKTAEEALNQSEAKELKPDHIFQGQDYLEKALEYNENFDLYLNDYSFLVLKETDNEVPHKSVFEEYEAYTDVNHCNNKLISAIAWHPMWSGIVALAYAVAVRCVTAADFELSGDEVNRDVFSKNWVLLWSFKDALKPRLILQSPREVHSLAWSPIDPNILVGGCTSGQIIIWDIKGKLDAVEAHEYLTPEQQRYRLVLQSLISWLQPQPPAQYVRPAALSNLQFSHSGRVTHIQWLPPGFEWNENGHLVRLEANEGKTSMQLLTTGEDGVIMVWDLNKTPEDLGGAGRPKKKKARKRPSALTAQISPFKAYNRKIRPIYMLYPELRGKTATKITCFSFRSVPIKYRSESQTELIKEEETEEAEAKKLSLHEFGTSSEEAVAESETEISYSAVKLEKSSLKEIKAEKEETSDNQQVKESEVKVTESTIEEEEDDEEEKLEGDENLEKLKEKNFITRKTYIPVFATPQDQPMQLIQVGTDEGDCITIKWEGFDFHKGEEITTEEGTALSWGVNVHDGPVVACVRSPFLENLVLTVGGRVIALWTHELKDRPLFWKYSPVTVTCGSWSPYRPCLFHVGRSDGSIEVWDLTKCSDSPSLVQSISGKVLTSMSEHSLPLANDRAILGVADFNNSFRLLYFPEEYKTPKPDELETLKEFVNREVKLRETYLVWNESFTKSNAEELAKIKAKEEEAARKHRAAELEAEQEAQLRAKLEEEEAKHLAKARQGNTSRDRFFERLKVEREKQMQRVLMEKKKLNKSDLIAKQQPILMMKEMEKEKRKKQREKIKHQQKIFDKTVAMLFPEVIEKPDEGPSGMDEFEAEITERLPELLAQYDNLLPAQLKIIRDNPFNKRLKWEKVFEEGMFRRNVLDFPLYLRQKRMERFMGLGADKFDGNYQIPLEERKGKVGFKTSVLDEEEEEEEVEGAYGESDEEESIQNAEDDGDVGNGEETKLALKAGYSWQTEGGTYLPGGAVAVAHQFLRCILHQLAPNGVFYQMFQTHVEGQARTEFFRSVALALVDFNELTPSAPLQLLLETLNAKKTLASDTVVVVCKNMAAYMEHLFLETQNVQPGSPWLTLLTQIELFFRRIVLLLPSMDDVLAPLTVMTSVLKCPGISSCKSILDPFSKVLSYVVQNAVVEAGTIVELCQLCSRAFTRDREKLMLTRMLIIELVQALKFKTTMPDSNFIMLINFVIQDTGNCLVQSGFTSCAPDTFSTGVNAAEIMRQHLSDALDFLADFHTVSKIKSFCQGDSGGLNEDTLGGALKSGVAQYVALEMARGTRDNRAVARHLPWLYNAPSSLQQNPREFLECMGHVRLLSWLLLGGLFQSLSSHAPCTPIPPEASCHVADHIQVILAGFAGQSKASVLHMSSLFHAFILCQLWTVYLEAGANSSPPGSEPHMAHNTILLDFWGKVTPCVLQLVAHSKVLAEMVNLHFLSLMEALLEVNASILGKLMPLWSPVLFAHHIQLPGHMQVRLQNCRNFSPTSPTSNVLLAKWLQRLQFKMGQIELQSSAATQFYSV